MTGKDIIITLPKTTSWTEYEKELAVAKDGGKMSFRLPIMPKVNIGNKCYLVHNGNVIGWMKIIGIHKGPFTCSTTGKEWPVGNYVERSGEFHKITPIPMKGFQGFRYAKF